jgi:hypothetical protein
VVASPVEVLKSAMGARRKAETELADLGKLLAEKAARLAALEIAGDLNNPAVIGEIGRLQVVTGLLPKRIAAKEEANAKVEESLTKATNEFIQQHLGPRVRKLAARTREIVEKELSAHFADKAALFVAVERSERVRKIESLSWSASVQPERGAMAHAEGALKAWRGVEEFEKAMPALPRVGGQGQ